MSSDVVRRGRWLRCALLALCVAACGGDASGKNDKSGGGDGDGDGDADGAQVTDVPVAEQQSIAEDTKVKGATAVYEVMPEPTKDAAIAPKVSGEKSRVGTFSDGSLDVGYEVQVAGDGDKAQGTYVKLEGADFYWDVPMQKSAGGDTVNGIVEKEGPDGASYQIVMSFDFPKLRENTRFCLVYSAYSEKGRVSSRTKTCITVAVSHEDYQAVVDRVCSCNMDNQTPESCRAGASEDIAEVRAFHPECVDELDAAAACLKTLDCAGYEMIFGDAHSNPDARCYAEVDAMFTCAPDTFGGDGGDMLPDGDPPNTDPTCLVGSWVSEGPSSCYPGQAQEYQIEVAMNDGSWSVMVTSEIPGSDPCEHYTSTMPATLENGKLTFEYVSQDGACPGQANGMRIVPNADCTGGTTENYATMCAQCDDVSQGCGCGTLTCEDTGTVSRPSGG